MQEHEKREVCRLAMIGIMALTVMGLVMSFYGCSSPQYIPVGSDIKIVEKETLIPMPIPADSASIRALLHCDENGKVVLGWFDTERSKNVQLQFSIDSLGLLLARMKTTPDTVYVPSKEVTIEKEIQVFYPVEKELNRWQKIKIELGGWAFGILIMAMLVVGWRMRKLKKR